MRTVHVNRTIVKNCPDTNIGGPWPIVDRNNPICLNITMGARNCAVTDSGIGNRGRLGRAVVAICIGNISTNNDSRTRFIMFLVKNVRIKIINPSDICYLSNRLYLFDSRINDDRLSVTS